jgi:hypothetical protein
MVTVTALKWTGVSPTVGNLAEATTVRAVAGAAAGVCPAAVVANATVQTKNVPIGVDRMWLSLNQFNGSNQTAVAATSAKPPIARNDPSLNHLVRAQPLLSGVAIFADLYRLNRAPEAEMAYRQVLSMSQQEPERRYLTRRLAELQNNNFRALSKSGFAKRLRV